MERVRSVPVSTNEPSDGRPKDCTNCPTIRRLPVLELYKTASRKWAAQVVRMSVSVHGKIRRAVSGYDANGDVIPRAWTADTCSIKDETNKEWTAYIRKYGLGPCAAELEHGGVDFVSDRVGDLLATVAKTSYSRSRPGWGGRR
jgi:hypothetical protein